MQRNFEQRKILLPGGRFPLLQFKELFAVQQISGSRTLRKIRLE
jgi:hypothetical protein